MATPKRTEYEEWAARQDPRSTPQNPYLSGNSVRAAPDSNFDITLGESLRRANMNLSDSAHGLTNALGQLAATETANYMKYKSNTPVKIEDSPILSLGQSLGQNLIPGDQGNEAMAQEVAKYYHDRYSSTQGFLQNFAEDPFPMALDVAVVSGLAKPVTTGAINATKAGIKATKAGVATAKNKVRFNRPDKMDPETVWHGGTLTDDVPIVLGGNVSAGQRRLGLHASSHPSGPILTYAKPKLERNIGLTQEYNKLSRSEQAAFRKEHKAYYGKHWDADPTLTEFTTKNAKPFFYNQPQKDVVKSVNSQIKTLKNEIKRKKKEGKKLTGEELIAFNEAQQATINKLGAFPSRNPPPPPTTAYSNSREIYALDRKIGELVSLRDGKIRLQSGITEAQRNILQDLGYQIIRPKHPTHLTEGALDKNHVLIIDKNLQRRTVADWEKAAERGRAQRETLGTQDMMNTIEKVTLRDIIKDKIKNGWK
jgi:hypothetical protein